MDDGEEVYDPSAPVPVAPVREEVAASGESATAVRVPRWILAVGGLAAAVVVAAVAGHDGGPGPVAPVPVAGVLDESQPPDLLSSVVASATMSPTWAVAAPVTSRVTVSVTATATRRVTRTSRVYLAGPTTTLPRATTTSTVIWVTTAPPVTMTRTAVVTRSVIATRRVTVTKTVRR